MAQKIEVPQDLNQAYVVPEGATVEQLAELAQDAQDRALALLGDDDHDPTQIELDQARWLQGALGVVQGVQGEMEQAAAERKKMLDELRSALKPTDPAAEAGDPAPTPSPADVVPEAVVAAANQVAVRVPTTREIATTVGQPAMPIARGTTVLTAAANVPGFVSGAELEVDQLGQAFEARASVFASYKGKNRDNHERVQHGFASIHVNVSDQGLVAGGKMDSQGVDSAIQYAVDRYLEALTPATMGKGLSALVAAGWCAPSQVIYDLLNLSTTDGLVTLPEISVERGGLKWATGPDFGTVYGSGMLTTLTETQAIAGNSKNRFDITCPAPQESRMNADALYLLGDILSNKGWPEAITDYITKALIVWQHYVSAKTIQDLVAGSTAVNLAPSGAGAYEFGAIPTVLGALELQVEDMRYRMRLSRTTPLEVILPFYARGILRSDMTKRLDSDGGNSVGVTDAQIDEWFSVRGMNPQFVYDWQDNISVGGTANPFGNMAASGAALTWPQTFQAILYAPGTWARALTPVIELSTLYDSTLLTANQYVALFTEQGRLTIKRGFDSRVITLQSNPSGVTGGYATPATPQAATPI